MANVLPRECAEKKGSRPMGSVFSCLALGACILVLGHAPCASDRAFGKAVASLQLLRGALNAVRRGLSYEPA